MQQVSTRDQRAPQRPHDGVEAVERLERQARDGHWYGCETAQGSERCLVQMCFQRHVLRLADKIHQAGDEWRRQRDRQQPQGPAQRMRGQQPAEHEQRHDGGRHQAAAQVVQQFRTRQQRQRVALTRTIHRRHAWKQPRKQLPIPTDPAVPALDISGVTAWIFLVQLHIADDAGARIAAFEQVVAENAVFRKAHVHGAFERIHVIDALAHERTFAEQILIDVRDGPRVRVYARLTAENAGIPCAPLRAHAGADLRLQDAVSTHDDILVRVELRLVERMRQRADQLAGRIPRQARVGIQGDDVADIVAQRHWVTGYAQERIASVPAQQRIERSELAAFAFVTHPAPFAWIPQAWTMQ